jgi:high-affinity nickel-transport protein
MIGLGAFATFALGLRHGADPDHLAAIDNLTRNSIERQPLLSRFAGTLFASGHTVMVLAIAALAGWFGTRFSAHGALIETIGTWISIVVLVAIALLNLRQLRGPGTGRLAGVKTRLLPRAMRDATSGWMALPVGFLFGFGFETSSQIATYSLAFGAGSGVVGALVVGATFCLGMVVTDTLDSVLVHRLVSAGSNLGGTVRVWIWSVTIVALAIAAYELAQLLLDWQPPQSVDLAVSGAIVGALLIVFAYVFLQTSRERTTLPTLPETLS